MMSTDIVAIRMNPIVAIRMTSIVAIRMNPIVPTRMTSIVPIRVTPSGRSPLAGDPPTVTNRMRDVVGL